MTLRLEEFPTNMQLYAKRNDQVYGCETVESPYVGGWCVDGRSVSYNDEAKAWLMVSSIVVVVGFEPMTSVENKEEMRLWPGKENHVDY